MPVTLAPGPAVTTTGGTVTAIGEAGVPLPDIWALGVLTTLTEVTNAFLLSTGRVKVVVLLILRPLNACIRSGVS